MKHVQYEAHSYLSRCSDKEILDWQELFLSNGLHRIQSKTIQTGRDFVNTFISSLFCFQNPGCLAVVYVRSLPQTWDNMHTALQSSSVSKPLSLQAMTQFFFDVFNHDVVIIEETQELLCQPWYQYIRTALQQSGVVNDVPVIIITYNAA